MQLSALFLVLFPFAGGLEEARAPSVGDHVLVVCADDGTMFALSPVTGEVVWQYAHDPVVLFQLPDDLPRMGVTSLQHESRVMTAAYSAPGVVVPAYDGSLWALRETAPPERLAKSVPDLAMGSGFSLSGDLLVGEKHVTLTFLDAVSGETKAAAGHAGGSATLVIERSDFLLSTLGGNAPMNLSVGTFDVHISLPAEAARGASGMAPSSPPIVPLVSSDHSSIVAHDPRTSATVWSFTPPLQSTIVSAFGLGLVNGRRWFSFNALRGVNGQESSEVAAASGAPSVALSHGALPSRSKNERAVVDVEVGGAGAAFAAAAKFHARLSSAEGTTTAATTTTSAADGGVNNWTPSAAALSESGGGDLQTLTPTPLKERVKLKGKRYSRVSSEGITLSWRLVAMTVVGVVTLFAWVARRTDAVRGPFRRAIRPCVRDKTEAFDSPQISPMSSPLHQLHALLNQEEEDARPRTSLTLTDVEAHELLRKEDERVPLPPQLVRLDAMDPPSNDSRSSPPSMDIVNFSATAIARLTSAPSSSDRTPAAPTALPSAPVGVFFRRTLSAPTTLSMGNSAAERPLFALPLPRHRGKSPSEEDSDSEDERSPTSMSYMLSPGLSSMQPLAVMAPSIESLDASDDDTRTPISSGGEGGASTHNASAMVVVPGSPAVLPATQSRYEQEFVEIEEIGRGAFGAVFKVRNTLDSREYAIKRINVPGMSVGVDDAAAKRRKWEARLIRLLREVKALAELEHPHIVRYYQAWLEHSSRGAATPKRPENASELDSLADWEGDDAVSTTLGGDTAEGSSMAMVHQVRDARSWDAASLTETTMSRDNYIDQSKSLDDDSLAFEWIRSQEKSIEGDDDENDTTGGTGTGTSVGGGGAVPAAASFSLETSSTANASLSVSVMTAVEPQTPLRVVRPHMPESVRAGSEMTLLIQMEFCGKTLRDMLRHVGGRHRHPKSRTTSVDGEPPSTPMMSDAEYVDHCLRVLLHVARALHHVHEVHGMVHRDLKPQNIFVMRNEEDATPRAYASEWHHCLTGTEIVKLGDFGLSRHTSSRAVGAAASPNARGGGAAVDSVVSPVALRRKRLAELAVAVGEKEQMSSGVGTLLYMSPEQAEARVYDAKTDLFSLGVIFFELGARVFTTMMERVSSMRAVRRRDPAVLKAWPLGRACKGALELLSDLVSENPNDRPSSSDLISRIQFLRGERVLQFREGVQQRGTTIRVEAEIHEGDVDFGGTLLAKINETVLHHPSVNVTDIGLRTSSHHATVELVVDAKEQRTLESLLDVLRGVSPRVTRAIAV